MAKVAFKNDNQKQFLLFPSSLDELIPATHSVRVVDAVIESLNVDTILSFSTTLNYTILIEFIEPPINNFKFQILMRLP